MKFVTWKTSEKDEFSRNRQKGGKRINGKGAKKTRSNTIKYAFEEGLKIKKRAARRLMKHILISDIVEG